jgi:outer membrane receptor protein involved in Fe transport
MQTFNPFRKRVPTRVVGRFAKRSTAMVCCFLLLTASITLAQGVRGNISGVVTDPNGAVVAGATVKLINVATQQVVRTVTTDESGLYQLVELDPATYDVVITAPGFAEAKLANAKLEPNRNLRLDTALTAAGAAEVLNVTASQERIDRESPALGTTVERPRIEGLPLNGRNVLNLALLQPGVTASGDLAGTDFGSGAGIRVNGQRGIENNFTMDGANNNEVAVGDVVGVNPPPDAVEEFRLLTSNFEAEFGRNTGSVINFVTRSGSRDFHGNARIFYRPTFLSAARYFDKANGIGDPRRFERKEFGGNLGGPFSIPGLYRGRERTFFFVDYEGRRQLIGDTRTITGLPTALERSGDFSQLGRPILDPSTGAPFPNNRIPSIRFSPIGQYYINFLPVPDATGKAFAGADQITNDDQLTARIDHQLTGKQSLNFTFRWFDVEQAAPFAFFGADVPGFGEANKRTTYNYVVRHTYAISPTLINSLLLGYARNNEPSDVPQNTTTPADIGFTSNFVANAQFAGPPFLVLFDRNLSLGNTIQGPQARVSENFQIQDSVSWVKGSHRLKFGFDGTKYRQPQTFLFDNQGIITYSGFFGGNTTGDDFADLLIGNSPIAVQTGSNGRRDFRQAAAALFAQDTWHVNEGLTLSLGLRWEYTSPLTDKFDRVAYYRPGAVSQILTSGQLRDFDTQRPVVVPEGGRAPVGLVYVGDPDPILGGTVPAGGVAKDWNNFGPRIGIAYSPNPPGGWLARLLGNRETVIRAGFGVFYNAIIADTILQQLGAPGFADTSAFFFPGSGTLANPFAPDPFPAFRGNQGQLPNPFEQSQFEISAPLFQFSQPIDPKIRTPYTYQYNLTVERGFLNNYVASVSYVGNRGLKQYVTEQINPAVGTFIPVPAGRIIPDPRPDNVNDRRLNPDIQTGLGELVSAANSWYNSLQAQVQKRFGSGLLFQVAYTFSKSITDADTQRGNLDLLDRSFGRGLSQDDTPHRFVASWIYDLPFAKHLTGVRRRLFDGFSFGGIATFASGRPLTVFNPFDTTGDGGALISFADLGSPYRNVDPRSNDSRAFNVDAFQAFGAPDANGDYTVLRRGTAGPNQVRVKNGVNNWDLIVSKKTRLWNESSNLELRLEMFNAFNHTQFLDADSNLNHVVFDPVTGLADPLRSTFGKFNSARESRIIQLGARITF